MDGKGFWGRKKHWIWQNIIDAVVTQSSTEHNVEFWANTVASCCVGSWQDTHISDKDWWQGFYEHEYPKQLGQKCSNLDWDFKSNIQLKLQTECWKINKDILRSPMAILADHH